MDLAGVDGCRARRGGGGPEVRAKDEESSSTCSPLSLKGPAKALYSRETKELGFLSEESRTRS